MDLVQDGELDLDYYARIMEDAQSIDFYLNDSPSPGAEFDSSIANISTQANGTRKRDRDEQTVKQGSKACREKMRRDKINERFSELSKILDPGRPVKTDKSAILDDALRILNQLKAEAKDLKEANRKLEEEIKSLKEEKHELREEKSLMKSEKEKMEEHVKAMSMVPAGYVPPLPAAYHPGANKMVAFPSYGPFPMWQWMPPAARDISKDHELRPPMA
ncbi:uncharacterized protein A4U43_C04F18030 [Asparagus officinalis]|uniref:BHLH domain-containing protein n=1 Tax=Asparagus officinalis TaxID=4686 RepID=A0A5P1F3K7_ASPOF|nr:transcription factor bHLH104-like [Asparagus officinalis]ONK72313.1 uncharacterized protein A4U43_C04F18030 [Asparagus officinalis]